MIEAQLLGDLEFRLSGQPIRIAVRKALALAAYLALEGRTPRSKLADLLWSDLGEEVARRNLRQVLSRELRPAFGEALESDTDTVWLSPAPQTDVAEFEARLEAGDLGGALALYHGPLLEGFGLEGAPEFEEWLEFRREQLAEARRSALAKQATALENSGDLREALEAHLSLLAEDALQESHQREAIRLYIALGERERALERFESFRQLLREELGLEPLPETIKTAERARQVEALPEIRETAPVRAIHLQPPLIGRKQAWAALEAGGPGLILLVGEPGVGKTRLATSFAATFGQPLVLRAQEIALQTPHYPIAEALRSALTEPRIKARLDLLEPIWRQEVARLVPELEPEAEPSAPSSEGRARFIEALGRALVAAAGPGGAILFDDLHWADPSSLELILHLARRIPLGPRLIATARPTDLEENKLLFKSLEGLRREGRLTRINLEGLGETEVRSLIQSLSGKDAPLFARRLFEATAGNPLYLLETLRHLFEVGALQADASGWSTPYDADTADYAELPIPPGVREAILDRVNRLDPAAQRLLEAASLADHGFTLEYLAPTVALDEWSAMEALEVGVRAGLLSVQGVGYRFSHPLVRRTLEDSLSPDRRRLVHRRLAQTLEAKNAEPARIATHLEQAGRSAEAAPWRVRAGDAAAHTYAHEAALEQYALALQHGLEDSEAFAVRMKRLNIHKYLANPAGLAQELEALQLLADRMGSAHQAEVVAERSEFWIDQGRIEEAWKAADEGLAKGGIPVLIEAKLYLVSAWALHRLGRHEQALERFAEVVKRAQEDAPLLAARALHGMSNTASARRLFEDATRYRTQAEVFYNRIGDRRGLLNLINAAARDSWLTGNTALAIEQLEQAIAGSREIANALLEKSYLLNLIGLRVELGDHENALANLKRGLELVREPREPRFEGVFRHREAQVRVVRGELGLALGAFEAAIALADQVSEGDGRISRRVHLAHVLRLLGQTEAALERLKEVQDVRAELGRSEPNLELEAELALCRIGLGQAQTVLDSLEPILQNPNIRPDDRTLANTAVALAHNAQGNLEAAQAAAVPASQTPGPLAELLAAKLQIWGSAEDIEAAQSLLDGGKIPPLERLGLLLWLADALQVTRPPQAKEVRAQAAQLAQVLADSLDDLGQAPFLVQFAPVRSNA